MEKTQIAIVGKKTTELVEEIERQGFAPILLRDNGIAPALPTSIESYGIDFTSKASVLKSLKKYPRLRIAGVVAVYENYIPAQHWIANYYSLPHSSGASIEAATDKKVMRECFQKNAPHITPAFQVVSNERSLKHFALQRGFPLMLKPTNLTKSLLVTRSGSLDELLKNYRRTKKIIRATYKKEGVQKKPAILVEERLVGSFHSIDAFVDTMGHIKTLDPADLVMGTELGFDDNFNYLRTLPSRLTPLQTAQAKNMASDAIRAVGLRNAPAHIEFVFTKSGPKIIEIGARIGGYRSRLYKASFGINLLQAEIDLARGVDVSLKKTGAVKYSALFEIFPKKQGLFHSVRSLSSLKKYPGVQYVSIKRRKGELVGAAKDGFRAVAVILLVHPDKKIFEAVATLVQERIRVRLV